MPAVDDYLDTLDPAARAAFDHVRTLALTVAPEAEQGVSYGVAALIYRGKPLLGFRAAKGHLSLYPFSAGAVDTVRDRLTGPASAKGTIRFAVEAPPPQDVLVDLIRFRVGEITATLG